MKKDKMVYSEKLPDVQPVGATFFVTCSLLDAVPQQKLTQAKKEYECLVDMTADKLNQADPYIEKYAHKLKYFLKIEDLLDEKLGPTYLHNPDIARILLARIESYHMRYYKLLALTIMPNHFHMLIDTSVQITGILEPDETPKNYLQIDKIVDLIKEGSSRYINQLRNTSGEQVWASESYDLYMRNEKMVRNVVAYIANNPVKAGIVNHHKDHPFTILNI